MAQWLKYGRESCCRTVTKTVRCLKFLCFFTSYVSFYVSLNLLWTGDPQQLRTSTGSLHLTLPEPSAALQTSSESADIKLQQKQYSKVSMRWAKCILILSVSYRAISIFRRLYCTALLAVHKLARERSVHLGYYAEKASWAVSTATAATLLWLMPRFTHPKEEKSWNCLMSFC